MQQPIDIRNPKSSGKIKQKIGAFIRKDDGTEILEFKEGARKKTILVLDFLDEIEKAHNESIR